MLSEREIVEALAGAQSIAVVGASSSPARDSHTAVVYLKATGFKVFPINPTEREIAGLPVLASVSDLPEPVDIVNVFRRPEYVPPHAREAVEIHAPLLWLQLGITSREAESIASGAGMHYVEDRCLFSTHRMLARRGDLEAPGAVLAHLAAQDRIEWARLSWVMGADLVPGPTVGSPPDGSPRAQIPDQLTVTGSQAVAPIRRDGTVVGALSVGSREPQTLGDDDLRLIEGAAERLSR
jgi:predicted CoA-binding protein